MGLLGGFLVVTAAFFLVTLPTRRRVHQRLFDEEPAAETATPRTLPPDRLTAWLVRAGHRHPHARSLFMLSVAVSACLGVAGALFLARSPVLPSGAMLLFDLPVVGGGAATLLGLAPWVAGLYLIAAPFLVVRARRRKRASAIEEDLPLFLETMATLAEAGFGFDASIAELLETQQGDRPLHDELRLYRLECQTGAGRGVCLQRLEGRIGLPAVTGLVQALLQAEEVGSGLAGILRPQAEDVRQRRRERALARAEALPEKLVVPLLIGFLPGLLVWTLGPAFHQLFGMLDAALP